MASFKKKDLVKLTKKTGESPYLQKLRFLPKEEEDTFWREGIENSNFSKVSSSTGRSWDYFRNKILNTYFPTSTTKTPKIL